MCGRHFRGLHGKTVLYTCFGLVSITMNTALFYHKRFLINQIQSGPKYVLPKYEPSLFHFIIIFSRPAREYAMRASAVPPYPLPLAAGRRSSHGVSHSPFSSSSSSSAATASRLLLCRRRPFPSSSPSSSFLPRCFASLDGERRRRPGGDDEDEEDGKDELTGVHDVVPDRWDVLGLGQAMVDFSGMVDDQFLEKVGIEKGSRKVINHEERGRILQAMDGCSYKAAAGGSLSNTLVALARLGGSSIRGPGLNVAMAGSIGSDPLGGFYRSKLKRANVNFLSSPIKDGTTGTVIVLTTPDAQRTMLAYPGTSSIVNYDSSLANLISKTNLLVIEGYLFELPHTTKAIIKACEDAQKNGALIAITASDISCIDRCYDHIWEVVGNFADILFANSDEARAFCQHSSRESPVASTRYLSHFIPLVSVTDGRRGSYIGLNGEAIYVPPSSCIPVDTCGAGDAYASGILYGIIRGSSDLKGMGLLASRVAATVVGQQGTRLAIPDAGRLAESFTSSLEFSTFNNSDFESDHISSF